MESERQHIRIKALFEILGKPKEHVEQKSNEYMTELKKDENLMVLNGRIFEAKQHEKAWSVISEAEIVLRGIENLVGFCIDYMPSSIDIIKPENFAFEARVFNNFVNDLLAQLHRVDMIAKAAGAETKFLRKNMNRVINNNILILAKFGVNKLEGLCRGTGIEEEELKKFLGKLIEEKRLREENGTYFVM